MLNYFTTLGDANDDNVGDGGCNPFRDRDGDGNTVSGGCDQRGAWDPQDFERQQSKIVKAINALDADVVGLMEIENSLTLGETADEATNSLVAALNADAGAGTWAANPSSTELPAGGMDVITNAIIYKPASVDRVGQSRALGTLSDAGEAFDNAREPLGQVFEADAGRRPVPVRRQPLQVEGLGRSQPGRRRQRRRPGCVQRLPGAAGDGAARLGRRTCRPRRAWSRSSSVATSTPTPWRTRCRSSTTRGSPTWSRSSRTASTRTRSPACPVRWTTSSSTTPPSTRSTGTDIWNINGGESLALEYSRWNYHATDFHAAGPYRSSDHDPVVLGLTEARSPDTTTDVQVLGSNDFHGRILQTAERHVARRRGALGAVEQLRGENPNTVFAAAGDLIGASTFESFIQKDKPTIDALNEAGLEVSAVGNHEFDQGYDDLVNRVMAPYDATTNPTGWRELEVHRRQRAQQGRRLARRSPAPGSRTSATSRSASSARSPRTFRPWSRRPASPTSR